VPSGTVHGCNSTGCEFGCRVWRGRVWPARADRGAAPSGHAEETRLDGDLAQRNLDAAQVGLHDGQQVGQGAGAVGAGLAHRDDLALLDAGAQRRDPFDMSLEGAGKVAVGSPSSSVRSVPSSAARTGISRPSRRSACRRGFTFAARA
jgi:hypothetical protein